MFEGNDLSGVLAFELSPTRVAAILDTRLGLGETGETFLVGIDHLFRNNSPFSAENDVRQTAYEAGIVDAAFASGRVVSGWESGYRGMDMLASAAPLSFEGTDWVLVAALGESEAMAAVDRMSAMIIAITGCVLIIAAGLGYLFSQLDHAADHPAHPVDEPAGARATSTPRSRGPTAATSSARWRGRSKCSARTRRACAR